MEKSTFFYFKHDLYFKCDIIKTFHSGFINTYIFENILPIDKPHTLGVWVLKVTFRQTT